MKKVLIACLFIFSWGIVMAQSSIERDKLIVLSSTVDTSISGALTRLETALLPSKAKELKAISEIAISRGDSLNNNWILESGHHFLAQSLAALKEYNTAAIHYRQALALNAKSDHLNTRGVILHDFAYSYYERNLFDSALYFFQQALEVKRRSNNTQAIAVTLNGIGLLFRQRNDFQTASEYYREALHIYELANDRKRLSVLMNIANLYNLQKKFDSATLAFDQIYKTAESYNDQSVMFTAKVNRALGLNYQARYQEALPEFESLSKDPRVLKLEDLNSAVQYGLGQAYFGVRDFEKAIPILKSCLNLKFRNTRYQSLSAITFLLYQAEKERGNFKEALGHYELLKIYSDSLLNINRTAQLDELEKKYKTAQKEQQIELLNKENQVKELSLSKKQQEVLLLASQAAQREQELKLLNAANALQELTLRDQEKSLELSRTKQNASNQQIQLLQKETQLKDLTITDGKKQRLIFILALSILVLVSVAIFYQYKNKQRVSKELAQKNHIISIALGEKEVLLKEIHHRVKNNLQVISSLLNLQSRSISDQAALEAINEGKNRVKSMALIHQNLYRDDDLTHVDMRDYIEKLIHSLFSSYAIQPDKIKLITHIDDIQLDVDVVVPLGLIINELVSNALKYAFEDGGEGILEIFLKRELNRLELIVKDNGKGLPLDWTPEKSGSMGYQIIGSF
ncbi:MAG: hypothetical protein RL131_1283, partial [Bacteroidota bacterium]